MNEKTSPSHIVDNLVMIIYKYLLPAITVVALLIVSQVISRPRILGSGFLDFILRGLACLWFCICYSRLPYLSKKYRPFPGSTTKKSDINTRGKIKSIINAIFFGMVFAFLTWWIVNMFLPVSKSFLYSIVVINGLICSIPLIAQYEIFERS